MICRTLFDARVAPRAGLYLGAVMAACLVGKDMHARADSSNMVLLQEWALAEQSDESCTTVSFSFEKPQQIGDRVQAVEVRNCATGLTLRLRYFVTAIDNQKRKFLTLNPPGEGSATRPVEVIEGKGRNSYQPDRITFLLSKDDCILSGSRRDEMGVMVRIVLHRINKECESATSPSLAGNSK